jgi:hypothetical protein
MGPRDRPRPFPDGATCTACGATVPTGRIRVLARRDDVAFVELACPRCGSTALGLLMASTTPDGDPVLDVAAETPSSGAVIDEPQSGRAVARSGFRPISEADVEALRRDLEAWDGDLVGWLDALDRGDRRGSVVDR